MNLSWSDVLTELMFSHWVSLTFTGVWAVGRWARNLRSGEGPRARAEWFDDHSRSFGSCVGGDSNVLPEARVAAGEPLAGRLRRR